MSELEAEFYNPGDIICETEHIAHVIFHRYRKEYCDYCCIRNLNVRFCSKCRYVGYCNSDCQKSAWRDHKLECNKMNKLCSTPEKCDMVLLIARIIRKLKNEQGKTKEKIELEEKFVASLLSFTDSNAPDVVLIQSCQFEEIGSLVMSWFEDEMELKFREIVIFSSKITYNRRPLYFDKEYGLFFYLGISGFQRSCTPNAIDFLNRKLSVEIRATQKIRKDGIKNVYLPSINIMNSFSLCSASTSSSIHFIHQCCSCQPQVLHSYFTSIGQSGIAVVTGAEDLIIKLLKHDIGDPVVRPEVELFINRLRRFETNNYVVILRLKLLVWEILLSHHSLFDVKRWEKCVIHSMRSLYGEQSFELYTVYTKLTAIYLEYKKLKFAKCYKAKSDELGALYGLPPHFAEEEFL